MSQNPKCPEKSDLRSGEKTKLTIQRVLDILRTELQKESAETEATTKFKEDLTFIEKEYKGIQEICNAYEKAYKDFNGPMKSKAQEQWESIKSWSDEKVPENVANEIKTLREGKYYAKQEENLKEALVKAEEEFHLLKDCHEYFETRSNKALEEFEKIKKYENTVKEFFADLTKLHDEAKKYKDAEKYSSVFVVRLEFDDVRKKTLALENGGSLAAPINYKKNLTNQLRNIIAFKHDRYLWHKDFLTKQDNDKKDLLAKEKAFEKAKQNYEDHMKNIRDRLIREAEDIQPAAGNAKPATPDTPTEAGNNDSEETGVTTEDALKAATSLGSPPSESSKTYKKK